MSSKKRSLQRRAFDSVRQLFGRGQHRRLMSYLKSNRAAAVEVAGMARMGALGKMKGRV